MLLLIQASPRRLFPGLAGGAAPDQDRCLRARSPLLGCRRPRLQRRDSSSDPESSDFDGLFSESSNHKHRRRVDCRRKCRCQFNGNNRGRGQRCRRIRCARHGDRRCWRGRGVWREETGGLDLGLGLGSVNQTGASPKNEGADQPSFFVFMAKKQILTPSLTQHFHLLQHHCYGIFLLVRRVSLCI